MKFLSSRQALSFLTKQHNGLKACASMSTSTSNSPSATPNNKPTQIDKPKVEVRRESYLDMFLSIFTGKIESAEDSNVYLDTKDMRFPHLVDQTTGEQKLLLLAFENGIIDPYCCFPIARNGKGESKDDPVIVRAFHDERIIGCHCEPTQTHILYTTLYKSEGEKRCQCGFWFRLEDAPRFWEKIPKEDLLEIPYFLDLEKEGKLDKLLAGEADELLWWKVGH